MDNETKYLAIPFAPVLTKGDHEGDDAPGFEGLLSTWDLDLGGDVIHRGAFKRTLGRWKANDNVIIPLLDDHDNFGSVTKAVGKLVEAEERKEGLWTRWEMVPDDPGAEAVLKRIGGRFVNGLSIGYRPVKIEMPTPEEQATGVFRHLKEVELREGSVVIHPMNPESRADASSVKALLDELGVTITVDASNVLDTSRLLELSAKSERTDDEAAELETLRTKFGAPAAGDGDGLAPDDPKRLAMDSTLQDIKLRGLATRP